MAPSLDLALPFASGFGGGVFFVEYELHWLALRGVGTTTARQVIVEPTRKVVCTTNVVTLVGTFEGVDAVRTGCHPVRLAELLSVHDWYQPVVEWWEAVVPRLA